MYEKLVTIAEFPDSAQAAMAQQILADHGIKSVLSGQHASNVYAGLPAIAQVQLQALESQAKKAKQILKSQKSEEQ